MTQTTPVADPPEELPTSAPTTPPLSPEAHSSRAGVWIAVLFSLTAFLGAALLFMVQPMIAKLVLPSFGGSATVWSTSSLFFQILMLVGYGYTHVTTRRLGHTWQPRLHLLVLLVPLLVLPIALPAQAAPDGDASPVIWLLRVLTLMIGLPFVVLATTGPLLQRWYSWSGGPRAQDPYFLFACSNLGSFVGLLAYPFLIEPFLTLGNQRIFWSLGFGLFIVSVAACALTVLVRSRSGVIEPEDAETAPAPGGSTAPTWRRYLMWTALAFLPSSLMLASTAHLSTDITPVPMLWVVPLAIYLASFIAAFARTRPPLLNLATRAAMTMALVSITASMIKTLDPALLITIDMVTLALVGYAAHGRLAADRPAPQHLTAFYLILSVGGALGGLLNGALAPLLFDRVWEYAATLILVPLLLAGPALFKTSTERASQDLAPRRILVIVLVVGLSITGVTAIEMLLRHSLQTSSWMTIPLVLALLVIGWGLSRSPVLVVLLMLVTFALSTLGAGEVLTRGRTFYGSYTVTSSDEAHLLTHGSTLHGLQFRDQAKRQVASTYYDQRGPLGPLMAATNHQRAALVGLGTGTIATYGNAGDEFTFFEIDPEMVKVADNPDLFSFLDDSRATITTETGDGRLLVAQKPAGSLDLIVLDAFSSDSIPVHLLTREAMKTYAERLTDDGALAVHISNRYFDLLPVLRDHANTLGLDLWVGRTSGRKDVVPSVWTVLTNNQDTLAQLGESPLWQPVDPEGPTVRWTDDFSSILSVRK